MRDSLRQGLAGLPAPKNDYEIVVPENKEADVDEPIETNNYIEDQAEVDAKREEELAKQREFATLDSLMLFTSPQRS